jgi:hypothetical protein
MPGYHIRTASGIQQVQDWYIKVLTAPSTAHTLNSSTTAGATGYNGGNANGGPVYGGFAPFVTANYEMRSLSWEYGAANEPTVVYMGHEGNPSFPPDANEVFTTIQITGVFDDSAGATVTRTLTRSNADFTTTNATWGVRQWQFRTTKAAKFLSNRQYAVTINRSTPAGGQITRVREAYVRTASGIQRYYPVSIGVVTLGYHVVTASTSVASGLASTAGLGINGNGDIFHYVNGVQSDHGDWIAPKTAAPGGYEVRATLMGSTVISSGPLGVWTALTSGSTVIWTTTRPGGGGFGATVGVILLEIRDTSGVVVDAQYQELHAERVGPS